MNQSEEIKSAEACESCGQRHNQLVEFGFELQTNIGYLVKTYEHPCGMWIAEFALDQYTEEEWQDFLNETSKAINTIPQQPF
jgi:hypothetical protein